MSISYDIKENEINIITSSGRMMIPLISRNWNEKETIFEMIDKGDMIYVD